MGEPITEVDTFRGFTVARVRGEIDLSNASEFAEELGEAVDLSGPGLIVDISSVLYIDSAGIRALFEVVRRLELRGQKAAVVVAATSPVRTLIEVTNLDQAIPVCETAEDCAAALNTIGPGVVSSDSVRPQPRGEPPNRATQPEFPKPSDQQIE